MEKDEKDERIENNDKDKKDENIENKKKHKKHHKTNSMDIIPELRRINYDKKIVKKLLTKKNLLTKVIMKELKMNFK